ncbi:uncharacterized protein LOC120291869 [Eucalyptus grandis]|uniref:uncharacterized protein LOC120291869 n=1 Tax=Eucalyptus grandis TaxID=71139 RepID=UPI00192F00DD|nr:uncharacterized protein LOC120291869 [Eucalyptus grandis]
MGLACQITLAILARRRRYTTSSIVRDAILAAYFLSSYTATIALSKLITLQTNNPDQPGYIAELKGLLAPLLLMHLGYPDSITAYSVNDRMLGIREIPNILVMVGFVVWILIRCWNSSSHVMFLYFPLFTAGIIRSAGMVWALKSVYTGRLSMSIEDFFEQENVSKFFDRLDWARCSMTRKIILKAYYRFDCLKPHFVNWFYQPELLSKSQLIVDRNLAFITAEVELGFMYDVLYTNQPILYNPLSLISRFTSFFCLVSSLCGFAIIFKSAFLIDKYITFTYALLMGVTALEGYQIVLQPFSSWAIVAMSRHQRNSLLLTRLLNFLAEKNIKQKRWSNSVGQLNLFDHRLYDEWPWSIGIILKPLGKKAETWRRNRIQFRQKIPGSLKELLVENIEKFNEIRCQKPFTEHGNWTLEAHRLSGDVDWTLEDLKVLEGSISTTFDKSIIIWHMATNICLLSEPDNSPNCKGSELLSNYMIHLLALRPYMLSPLTAYSALEHACTILKPFLRHRDRNEALRTLSSEEDVLEPSLDQMGTITTREFHLLGVVRKLAATLKGKSNKWQIISSIWVEMLCFAAYNCHVYYHKKLLPQGGELITHVWLLLNHDTDRYAHTEKTKGKSQSES